MNATACSPDDLPPLPRPCIYVTHDTEEVYCGDVPRDKVPPHDDFYSADKMREYGAACRASRAGAAVPPDRETRLAEIAEPIFRQPAVVQQDGEYDDCPVRRFAFTAHGFDTDLTPFYTASQLKEAMQAAWDAAMAAPTTQEPLHAG